MSRYPTTAAAALALMLAQAGCSPRTDDTAADDARDPLITRYVGTWEIDAFLAEPAIVAELETLLGPRYDEVMLALDVHGDIEYHGSALSVRGNAPHAGGEHEAIVCVQPLGTVQVHVGHYVEGTITIYTRQPRYDFLPTCMRDWVGLENAGLGHRLRQPGNVRVQSP